MKSYEKFLIIVPLVTVLLYLGGWRVILPNSSIGSSEKLLINNSILKSSFNSSHVVGAKLFADPDIPMYIYQIEENKYIGILNILDNKIALGSMAIAILFITIPFGVFAF